MHNPQQIGLALSAVKRAISEGKSLKEAINTLCAKDTTLSPKSVNRWYYANVSPLDRDRLRKTKHSENFNWKDYEDDIMCWYNKELNPPPIKEIVTPRNLFIEEWDIE